MTVYEMPPLPEEPPIGSIVVDKDSEQWIRGEHGWRCVETRRLDKNWYHLLTQNGRLTLVPTPFPRAPMVWAEGILWFRDTEGYYCIDGAHRDAATHPFMGPVTPVTLVPTVEWNSFVNEVDYHTRGYPEVDVHKKAKKLVDVVEKLEINFD